MCHREYRLQAQWWKRERQREREKEKDFKSHVDENGCAVHYDISFKNKTTRGSFSHHVSEEEVW